MFSELFTKTEQMKKKMVWHVLQFFFLNLLESLGKIDSVFSGSTVTFFRNVRKKPDYVLFFLIKVIFQNSSSGKQLEILYKKDKFHINQIMYTC